MSLRLNIAQQIIFRLREALEKAKIRHNVCEDGWYSCPKSGECFNDYAGKECNCGADQHNEDINKTLRGRKL